MSQPSGRDPRGTTGSESERAELLARLTELDRQLKRASAHATPRSAEELHACRAAITELHEQLDAMRASESWRFGNGAARLVLATVRPFGRPVSGLRRSWRARAANRYRAYREATSPGSALSTLDDPAPRPSADDGTRSALSTFVEALRRPRADGPRRLEPDEIEGLRRAIDSTTGDLTLVRCARDVLALLEPADPVSSERPAAGALVIDVRALQIPVECGTKTHAEHVVRAVCSATPPRTRVLMLRSPALPDLSSESSALFDGRFVPGATPLADVSAFLQLMTFTHGDARDDFGLLRAPWIRRGAIWLDAIMGWYPGTFLPTDAAFLEYQLGIEKLGAADHLLALSASCCAELPPNLNPTTRVTISGSRPGLNASDARAATAAARDGRYLVLIGNALPHKNVAGGVAAFAGSRRARREHLTLVVVAAALDDDRRRAAARLMRATGGDPTRVVFSPELDRADLAALIERAEAVLVPSFHEGFSLPIVETIGLGTAVVASDIPAHRELLGNDSALADPADPVAMSRVLDEVLGSSREVAARQRARLEDRYDPTRLDRAVTELIRHLLPAPRPPLMTVPAHAHPSRATAPTESLRSGSGLSHSKVCNLEDFSHPELVETFRRHFGHEMARFGPQFPRGREWRKHWEVAMAMRTLATAGVLTDEHDVLGVGAGNEPTIFLLTRYVRRVTATDLYLGSGWEETADGSMLTEPASHWPFAWEPKRLQVAHMDGRDLRFPDASFHGIFSSSSIEHFGDRRSIQRALDEMYRVLAPGGTLSISSEYRLGGHGVGLPGVALFDSRDVDELFVGDRAWSLIDPFDDEVSPATLATTQDFDTAADDQTRQVAELGGYWTHLIEFASYPHIVLARPPYTFTSFHLALRKHD